MVKAGDLVQEYDGSKPYLEIENLIGKFPKLFKWATNWIKTYNKIDLEKKIHIYIKYV